MKIETYLGLIKKLDVLINDELLEKENIFTLATKVTQTNDGMPHVSGTSDKVGNAATKLLMKQEEINHLIDLYVDLKNEIISQIRTLPADECDVLYRRYVLGEGLFDVAESRNQSVAWIQKLSWRGMYKMKVIESDTYKKVCKIFSRKM